MGPLQVVVSVLGEGVPLQIALVRPPPHGVVAFGTLACGKAATRIVKVRVCSNKEYQLICDSCLNFFDMLTIASNISTLLETDAMTCQL
jgi:hypothetical protein